MSDAFAFYYKWYHLGDGTRGVWWASANVSSIAERAGSQEVLCALFVHWCRVGCLLRYARDRVADDPVEHPIVGVRGAKGGLGNC